MRSIVISAIAISLIGVAPQIARAKQTYTVQQWPEDMARVPCSAFKRNPTGHGRRWRCLFFTVTGLPGTPIL
jgi:hypothetical protein